MTDIAKQSPQKTPTKGSPTEEECASLAQSPSCNVTPVPSPAGGWNPGDILAIEHVDRETGLWRWAIVSVSQKPHSQSAEASKNFAPAVAPSRRALWVRAWEPLPRRDLTAAERAEAARLESECEKLVEGCAKQRTQLDEAHLSSLQKQRCVNDELAQVEEHLRELLPLIETARAKVATISAAHIREIRSYRKPPPIVQRAVEPVLVLFGENKNNLGDWQKASHMMAAVDFVSRVRDLDPVQLPTVVAKQFVSYVNKMFPIPGKKNKNAAAAAGETSVSYQLSVTASEAIFEETDQPAEEMFPPGCFDAEIEATTRASAAAGRLLEWVLAMREFIVRAPKGAGASLQRVAALRQQQVELAETIEELEDDLKDVARRRAALDRAAAIIKLGAAALLIDQQLSRIATPMVLLRDDREGLEGLRDSLWRPNPEAPAFALPAVTVLGRLRSRGGYDDEPTQVSSPVETEAGSAVGFSRFVLTPDMAARVIEKSADPLPVGHTFDLDPPGLMPPPKIAASSPTPVATPAAKSEQVLSPVSVSTNPTLPAQLEPCTSEEVKQMQAGSRSECSATPPPTEPAAESQQQPVTPMVESSIVEPIEQPVKPTTATATETSNSPAKSPAKTAEPTLVRSSGSFMRSTSASLAPMSTNHRSPGMKGGSPNPKGLHSTTSGDWPNPKGNSPSLEARHKMDQHRPVSRPTACW